MRSKVLLFAVLGLGCGLFYVLEPGLDGEAWAKVQKVVNRERALVADKVDKVSKDMAETRKFQADIEARIARIASEAGSVKALSEELRGKLGVLELERQAAYAAVQACDDKVSSCAKPGDIERLCRADNSASPLGGLEGPTLRAMLEEEGGPLRRAVEGLVRESQEKDQGCTTKGYVDAKWSDAMRSQAMDGVGMRDYALKDLGGSVVGAAPFTSATFTKGGLLSTDTKKLVGLGRDVGGPNEAISKGKAKGDCFAFNGQAGVLTVKLSEPVVPTHVTIEHLNKVFSERGGDSAPRAFRVKGYADAAALEKDVKATAAAVAAAASTAEGVDTDESSAESDAEELGFVLAEGAYDIDGPSPVQVFPVAARGTVAFVRLEVLSNHGNPDYTCLYRLRVH